MNQQPGLCDPPVKFHIFVGEAADGCLWYSLDGQDKQVPIHDQALLGHLKEVRLVEREFRGRKTEKLELAVSADRNYVLRSGLDTAWSRGMLLALEAAPDFDSMLYFCVRDGESDKVVFSSLYTERGERVQAEWDKERDLHSLVTLLRARLGLTDDPAQPAPPAASSAAAPQPPNGDKKPVELKDILERVGALRKKLREEAFESASSLDKMLEPYGCSRVADLTREDAIKYGTTLKNLYERHVRERAERSVAGKEQR